MYLHNKSCLHGCGLINKQKRIWLAKKLNQLHNRYMTHSQPIKGSLVSKIWIILIHSKCSDCPFAMFLFREKRKISHMGYCTILTQTHGRSVAEELDGSSGAPQQGGNSASGTVKIFCPRCGPTSALTMESWCFSNC